MDMAVLNGLPVEQSEANYLGKDRWAQALVKNVTAVTAAFKGAGDQRHAARRTYLSLAPEARTEGYLEVIDEVLYQSAALSRLTRNARMAVARRAHIVQFQPGELLCVEGTQQDALLVIMSGEVEVVEGHLDAPWGSAGPPARFGPQSGPAPSPGPAPGPTAPPGPPPVNPFTRPTLSTQPSVASHSFSSTTSPRFSYGGTLQQQQQQQQQQQAPSLQQQPPASGPGLQLDAVHSVHPALQLQLQAHSSMSRRHTHGAQPYPQPQPQPHGYAHSHLSASSQRNMRLPSRNRSRRKVVDAGGGGSGPPPPPHPQNARRAAAAMRPRPRQILRRGDSLGKVDMTWLARLKISAAAAVAAMEATSPVALTSRAMLATKAAEDTGRADGGAAGSRQGSRAGTGDGAGDDTRRGGHAAAAAQQEPEQRPPARPQSPGTVLGSEFGGDPSEAHGGVGQEGWGAGGEVEEGAGGGEGRQARQWVRESWLGEEGGGGTVAWGGSAGGGDAEADLEALSRLRWSCTAVAIGRVECAAIGLHQLAAVLSTGPWDVEVLVDSLEELPVFAALSRDQMRQLVRVLKMNVFAGGTVVYKQGSLGNDLHIIRSGCVRLLKQVAVDDSVRQRLNRISAELISLRDQTAAAAAALQGGSTAAFGSSTGVGYVPPSRACTPRLPVQAGGGAGPGGGGGGSGGGGWPGGPQRPRSQGRGGAFPPGCPRTDGASLRTPLQTPHRPGTASTSKRGSGSGMLPPASPGLNGAAAADLPLASSPTGSSSGFEPAAPTVAASPGGSLPDLSRRSHSHTSTSAILDRDQETLLLPPAPAEGGGVPHPGWRHSITAISPGSPAGPLPPGSPAYSAAAGGGGGGSYHPSSHPHHPHPHTNHHLHPLSQSVPHTPALGGAPRQIYTPSLQNGVGGGGGGGGGGPPSAGSSGRRGGGVGGGGHHHHHHPGRHWRRRSSHATADELLDRFGVVPRSLGEQPEAVYEDVVMPGIVLGGGGAVAAAAGSLLDSGGYDHLGGSGADSDGAGGAGGGSLPPVTTASPGGTAARAAQHSPGRGAGGAGTAASAAAAAAAAAISALSPYPGSGGGGGATPLPVWQVRAPRQLSSGQDLVFVELGRLTAGQCFGEVRSDGVAVRSSSAVCDMRTEVLTISRNELAQRLGGAVMEYLWNQVPNEGSSPSLDPSVEAGQCAHQLERSMQWTLYKQKLVAEVLTRKEERRRTTLRCR